MNIFFGWLFEICLKRNIYYNYEMMFLLIERKFDKYILEIWQYFFSYKLEFRFKVILVLGYFFLKLGVVGKGKSFGNEVEVKVVMFEFYRVVEGRECLCEEYFKFVVNLIFKICNLERRFVV